MSVTEFMIGTILAFARIASFLFFVPFLKGSYIPSMAKVSLSLALAVFCANKVDVGEIESLTVFVFLILAQIMIGLTLALIVEMFFQVAVMAGSLMDFDMGLAMAEVVEPSSGRRVTVMATFFNILFILVFIGTGGTQILIMNIVYSFKFTDVGFFLGDAAFIEILLAVFAYMMTGAIQLALPFMATIFIVNFVFLIIGRASPQINIFANMFIIKIALGFLFIYLSLPLLGEAFVQLSEVLGERMFEIIEVMLSR